MARSRTVKADPYAAIPVLPVLPGEAYSAEALAPVITAWLHANGLPLAGSNIVAGIDVRSLVRGRVKRWASPITRLAASPVGGGNRVHRYTVTEAADVIVTFGKMRGIPDAPLPEPFRGHHSGARPTVKPVRKRAAVKPVARVKAAPAVTPAVTPADA